MFVVLRVQLRPRAYRAERGGHERHRGLSQCFSRYEASSVTRYLSRHQLVMIETVQLLLLTIGMFSVRQRAEAHAA